MKRIIFLLIVIAVALVAMSTKNTVAVGDKVRGEKAEGDAYRVCDSNYEGCPYGDYDPEPSPVMPK
jgi:hypothetical protein